MKGTTIRKQIVTSYLTVVLLLGLCGTSLGYYVVQQHIIKTAQERVRGNLKAAHSMYQEQLSQIELAFSLVPNPEDVAMLRDKLGLDYAVFLNIDTLHDRHNEIIKRAVATKRPCSGSRIIKKDELILLGDGLSERARVEIQFTPKASPTTRTVVEDALAIECAYPVANGKKTVRGILYGGKIINRYFSLVDHIHDIVFENKVYKGKPIGTVTIFQGDVRIATNVLNKQGQRAVGTRVSQKVYAKVIEKGISWVDRAFVVTDWYLTAYEPLKDVGGTIIGILYVGTLEQPFRDMYWNIFAAFVSIVLGVSILAAFFAYVLARSIDRPLARIVQGTTTIAGGDLTGRVGVTTPLRELNTLVDSFNIMAKRLAEREARLKESNDKLSQLNKSYLDLISFVAHELKGILSSAILNAYGVRDGILGLINFKQRKAMDAVCRNLDYFASTVKNFLSLSRVEKGELSINKIWLLINEDVFAHAVDSFAKQAEEKSMNITNDLQKDLLVKADPDLMEMVANNLVGNAIKYGPEKGAVVLTSRDSATEVTIEVYNDGIPFTDEQKDRLFRKFSRLDTVQNKRVRGTGLGLYITKEIITKHGGKLWVEARQQGNAFLFQIEKGGDDGQST